MCNPGGWEFKAISYQFIEPLFSHFLTATLQGVQSDFPHPLPERGQGLEVSPDSVVVVVTPELQTQLLALPCKRLMPVTTAPQAHRFQAAVLAFARCFALNQIPALAVFACNVRQSQKVKRPGFRSIVFSGPTGAEAKKARLIAIQGQPVFSQALLQLFKQIVRIGPELTGNNKVVCIPHEVNLALCFRFTPLVHIHIKHVVQKNVGQKRRDDASLGSALLLSKAAAVFLNYRPLNDLILKRRDAQRPLAAAGFIDPMTQYRLGPISTRFEPSVKFAQIPLQVPTVRILVHAPLSHQACDRSALERRL